MDRYQKVEKPKAETPIDENKIRITCQGRKQRYQDVMDALSQPVSSYTLLYEPHLIPTSKTCGRKKVDMQKGNTNARKFQAPKFQATKKVAAYKFPTNVKSLTVTGMFDGVVVRYLSASKEKELSGIIKGSGYLCGCQSCNYSKTVNAYEFEHHAGCKTSHPNNHIRFDNGKSMHQVVQELKTTPKSMLFDAIQTVTGSPINQKAFCAWKDSFEAVFLGWNSCVHESNTENI